ncbi:MAG: hypothetical protein JXR56_08615 [Candidatus Cloacimonetes bacterium]|nr:hypothetical protein [Candidatus Cloacimonadota bacterium]
MKKLIFLLLVLAVTTVYAEMLNYTYQVPEAKIEFNGKNIEINYKTGFGYVNTPGKYRIPYKQLNVLIPPGYVVTGQSYSFGTAATGYDSTPIINTPYFDGTKATPLSTQPEVSSQITYLGTGMWGNLRYLRYAFCPYAFSEGTLRRVTDVSFNVETEIADSNFLVPTSLVETTEGFFVNSEVLTQYHQVINRQNILNIITTPEIYGSISQYLNFRENQGFSIVFGNINDILSNFPGATEPEILRNYLISQYSSIAENYALLIGDFDTIPIQYLDPAPNQGESTPTDFYYSDLSSNFNSDGDVFIGEYSSGFGIDDYEIDFTPEMYVGRIPFSNISDVDAILQRILNFEQTSAPWKDGVLVPMAMFNFENQDYEDGWERTDGSIFGEYLKSTILRNNPVTTMYEQLGVDHAIYPSDFDLTYDNLQFNLNNNSYGFVCLGAHGSPTSSARLVWIEDTDENGICTPDERAWGNLINVDMFNNITNPDGAVFFTQSCLNGAFDQTNFGQLSLGEKMLLTKGVASVTATRTGWYKIGWINPGWGGIHSLNYYLMDNYYTHNQSLGMAQATANLLFSNYFFFGDPVDTGGIVWPEQKNIYTYTLFGDPLINYQSEHYISDGEILVWEPNGFGNSYEVVNAISEAGNWNVVYTDKLSDETVSLDNFSAVFCLFGFEADTYILTQDSFESQLLTSYLQDGGKVYCEGSASYDMNTSFYNYFNIWAPWDHVVNIEYITSAVSDYSWNYEGINGNLQALTIMTANPFTENALFAPQETYSEVIGIKTTTADAVTIGSSFQLAGATERDNTLPELINEILITHFELQIPQSGEDDNPLAMPVTLVAYPLPSSNAITFKIDKESSDESVRIYNVRGQLVRSIPFSRNTEIQWDLTDKHGRKVANGIYFSALNNSKSKPLKLLITK